MKPLSLLRLFVLVVLTCFGTYASATDAPLIGDAHVNSARPATNYGTLANLSVGNGATAFLQFDIGALPTGLSASQMNHATLTVFVNRVNAAGSINLSPVTSAWNESSLTYATIPTLGASIASFNATAAGQYVALDVTSLVQGWVTNPESNLVSRWAQARPAFWWTVRKTMRPAMLPSLM